MAIGRAMDRVPAPAGAPVALPPRAGSPASPHRTALPGVAPLLLLALLALLAGGCTPRLFKAAPPPSETLGPTVDSVVVEPFALAKDVKLNTADVAMFREQLETELKTKQGIRIFPQPPTTLPNTAVLAASLTRYQVREQTADSFLLRTIDVTLEVKARLGNEQTPSITLRRTVSYQKLYPGSQGVAALEFDLHNAAKELALMVTEALVPGETSGLTLVRAVDRSGGGDWSLPSLNKAIDYATRRRDSDALRMWSLVLFNPETPDSPGEFRVSERTLAWLRDRAVDEEVLAKLAPLVKVKPLELVPFRGRVRQALGGESALASQVLQLSDTHADHVHLNLYAAHLDLYRIYLRDKRYDVAAYHLSRAYAHYPRPELLEAWIKLQTDRELLSNVVKPPNLFWLYLRIPPPRTALVTTGAFDRAVLPPQAFEETLEPQAPVPPPQRVELPPPAVVPPPRPPSGIAPTPRPRAR